MYDVVIIGAGVIGCAIASELSKYDVKVAVVEKEYDVASGTSGRNSAVVHAGFNNKPGSLMASFCVEGNNIFEEVCYELGVEYKKTGKYLIAFDDDDLEKLKQLKTQGEKNNVIGLKIVSSKEVNAEIPNVGGIAALYSPNTAIINPFQYVIALAENAKKNGVDFFFGEKVIKIEKGKNSFSVGTESSEFRCKYIINAAGLFSDEVARMVGNDNFKIYPCRGEYLILDEVSSSLLSIPIYPAPKKGIGGLGVHLTPTTKGNIIIGPSAEYIDEKNDYSCTSEIIKKLFREAKQLLPSIEPSMIIGAYSGLRSKLAPPSEGGFRDFQIFEDEKTKGIFHLIGIESPGLTASVPIARYVINKLLEKEKYKANKNYKTYKIQTDKFSEKPIKEQNELIKKNPEYGEIVCRCEKITKKEIKNAIENPLGVKTISGIKYRSSATMGRCQGGYCLPKIVEILMNEYNIDVNSISQRGIGSELFVGNLREDKNV